jgi:hypothetical protein
LAAKNDSQIGNVSKNIHGGEDMTKQLVTLWSACADKGASKCTDIAGKFVTSMNSLLIDRAEDIKEIMTEENQMRQSMTRGVSLHF